MYKWMKRNFDFFVGGMFGLLYFFFVFGYKILDPVNSDWMLAYSGDCSLHVISWFFYVNSDFNWPLTLYNGASYPFLHSATYADIMPLYSVPFKLCRGILPEGFHFFGIVIFLNLVLQGVCSVFFLRQLKCRGITKVVGVLIILFSPILLFRIPEHISLSSHWVILLALAFWFREKPVALWCYQVLLLAALFIHPYLWIMVGILCFTDFLKRLLRHPGDTPEEKKQNQNRYAVKLLITGIVCLVGLYLTGFFSEDFINISSPSRYYAFNLNSPFNPCRSYVSKLIEPMPMGSSWESFSYLGAGVLFAVMLLCPLILSRLTSEKWWFGNREIIITCAILSALAINVNMSIGEVKLFQFNLPAQLNNYLSIIRGSGRFFWPVWYLIIAWVLVLTGKLKNRRYAHFVVIVMFLLQLYDLGWGLIRYKHNNAEQLCAARVEPVDQNFMKQFLKGKKHIFLGDFERGDCYAKFSLFRFLAQNGYTVNYFIFARDNRKCRDFYREKSPEFEAGRFPANWGYLKFQH